MSQLTITISGPQGSGKTTIANLIAVWLGQQGVNVQLDDHERSSIKSMGTLREMIKNDGVGVLIQTESE